MNINELGEDPEQQFGKPRNITEENVRFMLSLIKEEFDGTKVNENVERPSLEAFGMTILAVMSYQTTPWEELAKDWKPTFIPFAKARKRIETIFSQLTDQFLVIRNYAKITNGLFARIIGKISALTILQYVNFINISPLAELSMH